MTNRRVEGILSIATKFYLVKILQQEVNAYD